VASIKHRAAQRLQSSKHTPSASAISYISCNRLSTVGGEQERQMSCDILPEHVLQVHTCVASAVQPRTSHLRGQRCACKMICLYCLSITVSSCSTAPRLRAAAWGSVGNSCSSKQHKQPQRLPASQAHGAQQQYACSPSALLQCQLRGCRWFRKTGRGSAAVCGCGYLVNKF
jgi:hypothetical protein